MGVYDMYSASVVARRYDGFFVSGFGFAASDYGLPGIGFIARPGMVAFVEGDADDHAARPTVSSAPGTAA
ncbi:hypothetical protein GA0115254_11635 [Streptomyces sp. Ncost-T10-10d]|nr:hypothetical protein GA0115254_11635 [Streptomyces sp. Ncost-T10-10d]